MRILIETPSTGARLRLSVTANGFRGDKGQDRRSLRGEPGEGGVRSRSCERGEMLL